MTLSNQSVVGFLQGY